MFEPYKNYFIQGAILEALLLHEDVLIPDLQNLLIGRMQCNREIMWAVKMSYVRDRVIYLQKLGLIEIENDNIKISNEGRNVLKTAVLKNAASTAFFNYETFYISRLALIISILAVAILLLTFIK